MYNAAVKTNGRYTLKIVHDDDPTNPREARDNFGKMTCWHRRYTLGDKHGYSEPRDLLTELVRNTISENDIVAFVKDGEAVGLTLEYDGSNRKWELRSYNQYFKKWYSEASFPEPLPNNYALLSDSIVDNLRTQDLMSLAERAHIIQPLYLYDHGGQSISTQSFIGRAHHADWDSGQVGWTYASYADVAKEYGNASPENIERARKLLTAETETYDCYVRGDCYGFQLYRDGEEMESCWGFLGDFREAKDAIRKYVQEAAAPLVDSAEYGDRDEEDS
jgi:hypothetical protein